MALEPGREVRASVSFTITTRGGIDIVPVAEVVSPRGAEGPWSGGNRDTRYPSRRQSNPAPSVVGSSNEEGEDDSTERDAGGPGYGVDPGQCTKVK